MHRWAVVEQGQEYDDALDDRRSETSIESTPPVQVPSLDGFELVLPCRPPWTIRLPDFVRHLAGIEERLKTRFVRMRHVVRILGEPVRPGLLDAVLMEVDLTDDEDVRRLGEVGFEPANIPIDLLVVQDVAVNLRERGVAVADASQENDELQQVGVRLLPERLLRSAEQVVQQSRHGIGDGVGIELVVQRVVADAGIKPDLDIIRGTACPVEHGSDLATEIALHFQDKATELARRIVRLPPEQLVDIRIHAG